MELSLCIVNWNTRDLLRDCLTALLRAAEGLRAEIIVVDNASADGSAEMVRAEFSDVRLIENAENAGYARGNNQAIRASSGEFVLLLNPDVVVPPDGPRKLIEFLMAHGDAAAVAPRLRLTDGKLQHSVRRFPGPAQILWEGLGFARIFPWSRVFNSYRMPDFQFDQMQEIDQPMTSCVLFRRSDLEAAGLFDEQFRIYFNDVDLCYRLKEAGRKVYFTPEVEVLHHHGASTHQVWRKMVRESHRGLVAFYRKHYRGRLNPVVYGVVMGLIHITGWVRIMFARSKKT